MAVRRYRQDGAVTLAMTLWMLPLFALVVLLLVSRVNQALQVSYRDGNSDQLLLSAESGLVDGLLSLGRRRSPMRSTARYVVVLPNQDELDIRLIPEKGGPWSLRIRSDALAADGQGQRSLSWRVRWSSLLPRPPEASLLSLADVHLGPAVALDNAYTGRRLLAGGDLFGRPATKMEAMGGRSSCPQGLCRLLSAYRSMTADDLLTTLFGRRAVVVRQEATVVSCLPRCRPVVTGGSALYWLSGERHRAIELSASELGSRRRPVVVVVDGDLRLRHGLTVHGLLLVRGRVLARGHRLQVFGALAAGADVFLDDARLVYDAAILGALKGQGGYRVIAGSWRPLAMPAGG